MILRRVQPTTTYRRLADSAQRFVDELFWQRGMTRIETIPIPVSRPMAKPKRRKLESHLGRWIDISV